MKQIYIVKDKKSFISNLKPLTNIKVMTLNELEEKILGSYGNEARLYLHYNKNIPLNLVDIYLDTFKYLNGEDIDEKIKNLNELKNELINKNLYYFDDIFINSLNNAKITFKGFVENRHLDKIINILKDKCDVEVFYNTVENDFQFSVNKYRTLEDEVDDIVFRIAELIEDGISINDIKLMNVGSEYYSTLTRVLNQYKIPFVNMYSGSLDTSNYVIDIINKINEKGIKNTILDLNNEDYDQKIINIINDYAFLDDIENAKDFIIKDLKKIKISKELKTNYLELVDLSYDIKDTDKVFFLNLNNGVAPTIYDDSDLLTDEEYDKLGELNSSLKTNLSEKELLLILKKCYYISYKLISLSSNQIPSYIISKYKIKTIDNGVNHLLRKHCYYSLDVEKFNYTLARDHYFKTKQKNDKYECLSYNFKKFITNKSYSFTGISKESLKNRLNSKFNLSYSSINNYFKCKFQYYLDNILNLNKFETKLQQIRGTIYHKLLEECDKKDFDYDRVFNEEVSKYEEMDNKTKFFISLIHDEFLIIKEFNEQLLESSSLKDVLHEYKIEFHKLFDDYDITIKGFIDKVMYNENNIALIDFKTGKSDNFKLNNLYYGLDLQLPMYAYFVSKDEKLKNKNICGLYLQHVYQSFNDNQLKDIEKCKSKYRLDGYTNEALANILSDDYKNYLLHPKQIYSSLIISNIASFTDKKIDEAIFGIVNCDFEINPFTIDKDVDSCKYCKYKDVCYFSGKKKSYNSIPSSLFLQKVSNRTILLKCIELLKDEQISLMAQEEINNEDETTDNKLYSLIMKNNPSEDILRLLKLIEKEKEGE